jgi:hypothetical protein
MVYAYDEMSYEVESRENQGGVKRLGFLTLGLNFGMLQIGYPRLFYCDVLVEYKRPQLQKFF